MKQLKEKKIKTKKISGAKLPTTASSAEIFFNRKFKKNIVQGYKILKI